MSAAAHTLASALVALLCVGGAAVCGMAAVVIVESVDWPTAGWAERLAGWFLIGLCALFVPGLISLGVLLGIDLIVEAGS